MSKLPRSYASDPSVPGFDDRHPLAVMDGDCALCTLGARLIARFDRRQVIQITTARSRLGSALLRHYGLDADDPETWLFVIDGQAYEGLDAVIRAGRAVGGIGWLLQPLRLLPRSAQGWIYARVARNRYALFGRTDMCAVPDPKLRARLID